MNVRELIEKLQKFPLSSTVYIDEGKLQVVEDIWNDADPGVTILSE